MQNPTPKVGLLPVRSLQKAAQEVTIEIDNELEAIEATSWRSAELSLNEALNRCATIPLNEVNHDLSELGHDVMLGFGDFYKEVRARAEALRQQERPSDSSDFPTFEDKKIGANPPSPEQWSNLRGGC